MAFPDAPASPPLLRDLVGGFVVLALGLAWLTRRRPADLSIASREGTRRAASYILAYTLCTSAFWRVVGPALMGRDSNPWLLALGDVIFTTLGLFVWVMVLAESRPWRDYGFHLDRSARVVLTLVFGAAAGFLYASPQLASVASGRVHLTADSLVFALLFAAVGSALPEELLFRGYLQGSLHGRFNRWARVMVPALVFAAYRGARFAAGAQPTGAEWLGYVLGVALPLGMWWGLMRDLAGGSLWPSLVSHFVAEFGGAIASASPSGVPHP